jgi:hypothetical protein
MKRMALALALVGVMAIASFVPAEAAGGRGGGSRGGGSGWSGAAPRSGGSVSGGGARWVGGGGRYGGASRGGAWVSGGSGRWIAGGYRGGYYGGYRGYYGGGYRGGYWYGGTGIFIGGLGWWGWPGWWGASYPYYAAPPVVVQPAPTEYIQQAPAPQAEAYWYYCQESGTYYPYVQTCPGGWVPVVPQTTPPGQ